MDELKVHICHVMLWEFTNNKKAAETVRKICSVYCQIFIIDHPVENWFLKFPFNDMSLRNKLRPRCSSDLNHDTLKELVEYKST